MKILWAVESCGQEKDLDSSCGTLGWLSFGSQFPYLQNDNNAIFTIIEINKSMPVKQSAGYLVHRKYETNHSYYCCAIWGGTFHVVRVVQCRPI